IVGNGIGQNVGDGGCDAHNPRFDFNDRILGSTASFFVQLARRYLQG
ncbi:MAG: amidohydrolase, partial [Rubrivivax sp.]|nr:amidohydrolase [Rubrivivax sp.]